MRVVVATSLGGSGHLEPIAAVGRQLAVAGHDVSLLVPPALEASAKDSGLDVHVGDEPSRDIVIRYREHLDGGGAADPGLIDRELFAGHCTRAMLSAASELFERARPELVLREPCEYASAIAAIRARIPCGTIAISQASIEDGVLAMAAPVLDGFEEGTAKAIAAAPYLTAFPASLDPSPFTTTVRYRVAASSGTALPPWGGDAAAPLVYATFGSVVGHTALAVPVLRAALEALGTLPVRALLTVGRAVDPASLGEVPHNVRVERWVPQHSVLAECAVVVCHGGSGTTYGALAAGVPVVVCPLYADNLRNGATVARAGVGLLVAPRGGATSWASAPGELGPSLRAAVLAALADSSLRDAARVVGVELGSYPLADVAVASVEWSPRPGP